MNYQHLLDQVCDYALNYFKTHNTDKLVYHNKKHTEDVAKATNQIANHYQLNDRDFFVVSASAWFHDLGYMVSLQNHEEHSVDVAHAFLEKHNADVEDINTIESCIRATKMPQQPVTLLEKILCDADLFHLGTEDFAKKDRQMFEEYNGIHKTELSKLEWRQKSITFLESHHYNTDYCRLLLDSGKEKNIEELKAKVANAVNKTEDTPVKEIEQPIPTPAPNGEVGFPPPEIESIKKKKDKKERPEKGIETMFRISSSNHQRLSDMADNKAHIMITVNSIILSAIISLLLRRLSEYEYLIVPTFILLTVSLLAMTFSILSTRPSIPPGTFTKEDVDEKKVNLLFFGNFYRMPIEDYIYGMQKVMEDKEFLYGSLIKDVYTQGVVLGKKYRLLRIGYNIFMFGLIIAVIAFIIASAFFGNKPA
ncbi:HD domain-containing protein [Mucilaginibacter sp. R11]|uniref:HD domain-containing protein n=1 Tax=Mucilaginibacter agri TaxID=2695265 RepID=A0A966DVI4_9SPHI|nr:HD domain-containing protein [Mucilaginibacter agri]